MRQDDYFLKQIDMLGRILGKILSNLLKLNKEGEINGCFEITSQALKDELNLNINEILQLENKILINFLQTEKKFTNENLEQIAEILFVLGIEAAMENRITFLEKSLTLYEYANENSISYSLKRIGRIKEIRSEINRVHLKCIKIN